MDDWRWMTAEALGRAIGAGGIDPVALTEVFLEAIDRHAARDRVYTTVTHDLARAQAKAASKRAMAGTRRGPLDGVPISWKDLFDTRGIATEAGTALMANRVPDRDAPVVARAAEAGLVCLGKTQMSEIAFSGLGVNPVTATPPNRNDPEAAPGGSSSGAAASVAFGLAAAAIGSDTGGSVRVPSAWNDLTGFKTSFGRIDTTGTVPLCRTFDTIGPLCRSIPDARLLVEAMTGERWRSEAPGTPRLAVLDTIALDDLEDAPDAAFERCAAHLRDAGVPLGHLPFPPLQEAFSFAGPLYTADAWAYWRERIEAHPDTMFHQIEARVRPGGAVLAADYLASWARLREIRDEWDEATGAYDALIAPTVPILPPKVARLMQDDSYYKGSNLAALRNTRIANLMDIPSVTLPTGTPSCGLMLLGRRGGDDALLAVAETVVSRLAQKPH